MDYALQIQHLQKDYSGFSLKDISLALPKGCIMGLIGENGAGKSTTFKCILDLIHPDHGSITFDNRLLKEDPLELKEELGVVFDELNFHETLTPKQIGSICASTYRTWDTKVYENYLNTFSLPPTKELKTFSKGMQVKLSLSVALSHHPKLLLLDEATSGLDPVMRDDILDIFLDFVQDEEHSILISSHITTDLEKVADYIAFIHEGHLIFSEKKDTLIYNYGIIRCGSAFYDTIDPADIIACRKTDYQWNVLVCDKQEAAFKYKDVVIDHATIDEIMLLYVKGESK
ncbi:MAG: ABC transporter ATP-binding protein [Lachnospiraceae bacterium]